MLFSETISLAGNELQAGLLPFLLPVSESLPSHATAADKFVLNSRRNSATDLKKFKFIGKLMGIAMRTANILPLDLHPLLWKQLVGDGALAIGALAVDAVDSSSVTAKQQVLVNATDSSCGYREVNATDSSCGYREDSSCGYRELETMLQSAAAETVADETYGVPTTALAFAMHKQLVQLVLGLSSIVPAQVIGLLCWQSWIRKVFTLLSSSSSSSSLSSSVVRRPSSVVRRPLVNSVLTVAYLWALARCLEPVAYL